MRRDRGRRTGKQSAVKMNTADLSSGKERWGEEESRQRQTKGPNNSNIIYDYLIPLTVQHEYNMIHFRESSLV